MENLNKKKYQDTIKKNKKPKNKLKAISIIVFIISLSMWFLSWIAMIYDSELATKLLLVTSLIIAIPIGIYMIAIFFILVFNILLRSNNWRSKIIGTLAIINGALFILGVVILFLGAPLGDKYIIEKVKVLDIRENKILIDDSINNHGDKKIIEINKPFYAHIQENDTISVRYPNNKREKMYYVIDSEIGESLLGASIILCIILMGTHTSISIVSSLKSTK